MDVFQAIPWILALGGVLATLLVYPYVGTAISYRRSDNGLAFILLVIGIGVWNGMFAAQLLDPDPVVKNFFFSLSAVGATLAALGWFLFAATASSTRRVPRGKSVYGGAALLVGVDIAMIITAPAHNFYWSVLAGPGTFSEFTAVAPSFGYWLHTQLHVALFGAGTVLFALAWEDGVTVRFTRRYTVAGIVTIAAVIVSNVVFVGGVSFAPLAAVGLMTIGWLQADDGRTIDRVQPYLPST